MCFVRISMAVIVPAHSYLLRPYTQAMETTGSGCVVYIVGRSYGGYGGYVDSVALHRLDEFS